MTQPDARQSGSVDPYTAGGGRRAAPIRIRGYKRKCMAGCCGQANHQVMNEQVVVFKLETKIPNVSTVFCEKAG